jgi:hypothetical protein
MRVGRGVAGEADEGRQTRGQTRWQTRWQTTYRETTKVVMVGRGRRQAMPVSQWEVQSRQTRRAIRAGGEVQGRRRWSVRADSTRRRAVGIVRSEGDRPRSGESRVRAPGTTYGQWTRNVAGAQRGQKFLALRVGLLLAVATTTPRKFTPRDTVTSCCGERWERRDGEVKGRQPRESPAGSCAAGTHGESGSLGDWETGRLGD